MKIDYGSQASSDKLDRVWVRFCNLTKTERRVEFGVKDVDTTLPYAKHNEKH
jgi:hypothetical protein